MLGVPARWPPHVHSRFRAHEPMSLHVTALRRPGTVPLDPAEAQARSVRRRVNAAWGLLYLNSMAFAGPGIARIPHRVGQAITQAALLLAILVALSVNPKVKVRPNVFLCLVGLLALDTLITVLQPQYSPHGPLGAVYRTIRFFGFVAALWLLTPWWGRRDMLLLRCHLRWLFVAVGLALLGLLIAPGHALRAGRLSGVIWAMPDTQLAHYAAVAAGLTLVLWLGRLASGRVALVGITLALVVLLLTHTRTAVAAVVAGVLVGGLSLFTINSRVRKFFATGTVVVSIGVITAASVVTTWLARGQNTSLLQTLTGRTKFWALVGNYPRTPFQEIFGFGLSNANILGLPIDSNWFAAYMMEGLFGVVVCAMMLAWLLVAAFFRPRGMARALALFLVTYCLLASYTEIGFADTTPYLLDLTVAASLLVVPLTGMRRT